MNADWRIYRPAIWSLMLALAVALVVKPWFLSLFLVGIAIGMVAKTWRIQRRRRR